MECGVFDWLTISLILCDSSEDFSDWLFDAKFFDSRDSYLET